MNKITKFSQPKSLGEFKIFSPEVMYYLYLPIGEPGYAGYTLPDKRLLFIQPLLDKIREDEPERFKSDYVYVTIKKMYIGGGVTANRPGWHCDGFLSDDLNYIWYDNTPTVFNCGEFEISADHVESLRELEEQANPDNDYICANEHLYKLDSLCIHRVNTDTPNQIMRTFVKVTLSPNEFNLKDNSINYSMKASTAPKYDRSLVRNDPYQAQTDAYKAPNPTDDHLV